MKGFVNTSMPCPHCLREAVFVIQNATFDLPASAADTSVAYIPKYGYCPSPECGRLVILIERAVGDKTTDITVLPPARAIGHSEDVPKDILKDYAEATQILEISPNASAALARRCLQATIQRELGKSGSRGHLRKEIEEFRAKSTAPPYLKEGLDEIRILGNVGAHPGLDEHTSMIVGVEPDDARWLLRILEELFKHCFVAPKEFERRAGHKGKARGA